MIQPKQDGQSIIGYFRSLEIAWDASTEQEDMYELKGAEFKRYFDELEQKTASLNYQDYGSDIELILLEFHLFTNHETAKHYEDLENYRPKEKSIAANILIYNENFFDKSDDERRKFLAQSILSRISALQKRLARTNLDTNIDKLVIDIENSLK